MKPLPSGTFRSRLGARTRQPSLLLLAAAVWHVAVTTSVFLVGRFGLVPGQFDQRGLGTFAADGFMYHNEIVSLCGVMRSQGVGAWASWPTQLHVRLYSLPVFLLTDGTKLNILTIEPLNLMYYLAILVLVFKLGKTAFNYRTGIISSLMVAIWPSFLLHTTQLLRDPLLITALLVLMVTLVLCLQRDYAWPQGILLGLAGTTAIVVIRIVRLPMWPLLAPIVGLAVLFLALRLIRRRSFVLGNIIFAMILIAAVAITPRFQSAFHNQQVVNRPRIVVPEELQGLSLAEQIAIRRHGFEFQWDPYGEVEPSGAGSDIDKGVSLKEPVDILRQIPRAVMVGFLAPFPNMWLTPGKQIGTGGRLISGFETLLTYGIEGLALFGLWSERKNLSAWLLALTVTLGAVALGLVVVNIGALYRLRYPFWTLLIVCGATGLDYLLRQKESPEITNPVPPAGTLNS